MQISLERIRAAAALVAPHVLRTPTFQLRDDVTLKLECLQRTGSFKLRGFFAAALSRPRSELDLGLVTVSAGNAALAAAYVARKLGVRCRVFMYDTAPAPKLEGVRALGAEPVLLPRDELVDWIAKRGWQSEPGMFVHPFADEELIVGHASLGLELADQVPGLARVLVPVGGGGLIAGVAAAIKQLDPSVEVIGVQSDGYAPWPLVLATGTDPQIRPQTIADGTTAPFDATMLPRLRESVDRWLIVPEPRLRVAVAELAMAAKVVAEGAGALAFAAIEQLEPGPPTACVISGGNIDPRLLAELLPA